MGRMRRRSFLATVGAGALGGCSALGSEGIQVADDPFTDVSRRNRSGARLNTGLAILPEGEYARARVTGKRGDRLRVTGQVMRNGPIDLYLMTLGQLNEYQREPALIDAERKAPATSSPELSATFDRREYFLVIDNTHLGSAEPSGTAEFQYNIRIEGDESAGNGSSSPTPE